MNGAGSDLVMADSLSDYYFYAELDEMQSEEQKIICLWIQDRAVRQDRQNVSIKKKERNDW